MNLPYAIPLLGIYTSLFPSGMKMHVPEKISTKLQLSP
jgi:hypothetical protein